MQKIMAGVVLCLLVSVVHGWQQRTNEIHGHHIGVAAGTTVGEGLSYRWMKDGWGFQFAFLPIVSSDFSYVTLGLTGMRGLHTTRYTQLFLYASMAGRYISHLWTMDTHMHGTIRAIQFNVGGGPGINLFVSDHIVISVMGGYAMYNTFPVDSDRRPTVGVNFTGEAALFYRW